MSADDFALRRWLLEYVDAEGARTSRAVVISKVRPVLRQIVGWCELRNEERTFSTFGIVSFTNPETGEVFDCEAWLTRYRSSARNVRTAPDMSAQAVGRRKARNTLRRLL